MLSKISKQVMRKITSYCENFGVEIDLLDYEALYDNTLTEGENLTYIKSVIEDMSENRLEGEFKVKKKSIKSEKEEKDRLDCFISVQMLCLCLPWATGNH